MSKNSEATTAAYKKGFENGYQEAASAVSKDVETGDSRDTPEHIDWEARRVRESVAHMLISNGGWDVDRVEQVASWILGGPVKAEEAPDPRLSGMPERPGLSAENSPFYSKGYIDGRAKGFTAGVQEGYRQAKGQEQRTGMFMLRDELIERVEAMRNELVPVDPIGFLKKLFEETADKLAWDDEEPF